MSAWQPTDVKPEIFPQFSRLPEWPLQAVVGAWDNARGRVENDWVISNSWYNHLPAISVTMVMVRSVLI